ncbi:MAG: hypothetical protein IAG13_29670 [Deltaproteobacteria bacterium]|nr:hypothetical protein [Nannocystaceae bacterium]
MRNQGLLLLAAVLAYGAFGSSDAHARPLSEKVTERVVDSAIESGLDALSRPENQKRLGSILSSKAVTGGVHDITVAVVAGVLDGVEGRIKLPAFDFDFDSAGFWKGFDNAARKHVGPAVANVTRSAIDAAMSSALSEENGARIEALAAHATHGVIKGLAKGIQEDLAPALAHAIVHDLAPAGAVALEQHIMPATARALANPGMQTALAMTMSTVARALVRGGDDGIATAKAEALAEGEDGPIKTLGERVSLGLNIGLMASLGLGGLLILFVVLVVLLVRSARGQQRLAEQGRTREHELLAIVEQLDTQEGNIDKATFRDLLQQHLRSR